MNIYSCDFETNNSETDCRVWLYGIWDIFTEKFWWGSKIKDFFTTIEELSKKQNITISFHNLKFDGVFFLCYIMRNGYKLVKNNKQKLEPKEFHTLISDMGVWYTIELKNQYGYTIKIVNTLCIYPFKLSEIAKSFNIEEKKGSIDYDYIRPEWYHPTSEEVEYVKTDCIIAGKAFRFALQHGDNRLTAGANALQFFKKQKGKKDMEHFFPKLSIEEDAFVRNSYKGGWTYVKENVKGKNIGKGIVLDVNSLYPSRMRYCLMPFGKGVYYTGKYDEDDIHPLYVQHFECSFELKKRKLPTLQIKNNFMYKSTEYVKTSNGKVVELTLTSVDLKLFFEHYKVKNIHYIDGYKYMGVEGMFDEYIDYWMEAKKEAEKRGDKSMRTLSKLKLNSLYGKFAKRPKARSKYPVLDENNVLHLELGDEEEQETLYIPVGTFITSYARDYTIRSAQANYPRFLYADTDSLHLRGLKIPENIEVDKYELGKWKHEATFTRAKYLGAKCYVECLNVSRETLIDYLRENPLMYSHVNWHDQTLLDIKCAGLPDVAKAGIDYDAFKISLECEGKLKPKNVPNGVMLKKEIYKIRPR